MAPIPSLRKIALDTLKGAPEWVEQLLQPLNSFMGQVQEALAGQLTVKENLAQCWVSFTTSTGDTVPPMALPGLRGRSPHGVTVERVVVLSGALAAAPGVEWSSTTVGGKPGLQVRVVHGINTPGTRVTFTLLVKAE